MMPPLPVEGGTVCIRMARFLLWRETHFAVTVRDRHGGRWFRPRPSPKGLRDGDSATLAGLSPSDDSPAVAALGWDSGADSGKSRTAGTGTATRLRVRPGVLAPVMAGYSSEITVP